MLTLDEALEFCVAARAAAAVPTSFSIMDPRDLLAFTRGDGVPWVSADVAQGKAWTAAADGVPSAAQKGELLPVPASVAAIGAMIHRRFPAQIAAVAVYRDGIVVGASGASSGTQSAGAVCGTAVQRSGFLTVR